MTAHIIAQLLQGDNPDLLDLDSLSDPWCEGAKHIATADAEGTDRFAAYEGWIASQNSKAEAIRAEVEKAVGLLYADPEAFTPDPTGPIVPPLPEAVQVDLALGLQAGQWVDVYTEHAVTVSPMTPRYFHESAALGLASMAIARRLRLPMAFDDIYPNLFLAWVAYTTLWRKSTGLNVLRKLARKAIPQLLAAQETTPEAFLSDLAGREPANFDTMTINEKDEWSLSRNFAAQKGWILDEMSGLLSASGKDYNAGLVEALLRFYDCDPHYTRSTRGQGRVTVRNSCLTMIGASTPAALATHLLSERLWGMGWWPRFAVLTPEKDRPEWKEAQEADEPAQLTDDIKSLYNRLPVATWPDPPKALTVTFDQTAFKIWQRYNKAVSYDMLTSDLDQRLWGAYGRLPTHALKVAIILAALDWPDGQEAPRIEEPHLARAVTICEQWRASAHRALALVTQSDFDQFSQRIMRQLGRHEPQGATLRELCRSMSDKEPADIKQHLEQMVELGTAEPIDVKPGKKGGRPTIRYRLTRG